jgi:hypothetical protein
MKVICEIPECKSEWDESVQCSLVQWDVVSSEDWSALRVVGAGRPARQMVGDDAQLAADGDAGRCPLFNRRLIFNLMMEYSNCRDV